MNHALCERFIKINNQKDLSFSQSVYLLKLITKKIFHFFNQFTHYFFKTFLERQETQLSHL